MKPTIGRIVIYREGDRNFGIPDHPGRNGSRDHPALITQVWSDTCVNLTVFHGDGFVEHRPSITIAPELPDGVADVSGNDTWRWPEVLPDPTPEPPPPHGPEQVHATSIATT